VTPYKKLPLDDLARWGGQAPTKTLTVALHHVAGVSRRIYDDGLLSGR
jgi:hypothetical protein